MQTRSVGKATGLLLVAVLGLAAGAVVYLKTAGPEQVLQASSSRDGHDPSLAAPGVDGDWRSGSETAGAWLQSSWDRPLEVRRVVLEADPQTIRAGFLRFSDGSQVFVDVSQSATIVPVTPREVTSVRFTVTESSEAATSVSIAELSADGEPGPDGSVATDQGPSGDVAPLARLIDADPALIDRDAYTDAEVMGAFTLQWSAPRELTSVSLTGSDAGILPASSTLTFSDGSTLPVGAVIDDPRRPTTVAFMPRVTTSLRITVVEPADASVRLSSVEVHQRGADPAVPAGNPDDSTDPPSAEDAVPAVCAEDGSRPADPSALLVRCPTSGADVGDTIELDVVTGPSVTHVSATAWSADAASQVVRAASAADAAGNTALVLDVAALPTGPVTVEVQATAGGATNVAYVQVVRPGPLAPDRSPWPAGRTLVYEDQFDRPLSASRDGAATDYIAGKPEDWGVTDFGQAIFADPRLGLGNLVSNDGYLQMSVGPRPAELIDPNGWGREHIGGMLASARPGGSGFGAQYGYFEARIAAPAGAGTWPAFWLLGLPDLVRPQPVSAEIDAIELYGHDPRTTCHATHVYPEEAGDSIVVCDETWASTNEALQWHTFAADVRPDRIVYLIDGQRVAEAPQVEGGQDPMFFMIDLALGGGWPVELDAAGNRASLYVDWVRVFV